MLMPVALQAHSRPLVLMLRLVALLAHTVVLMLVARWPHTLDH